MYYYVAFEYAKIEYQTHFIVLIIYKQDCVQMDGNQQCYLMECYDETNSGKVYGDKGDIVDGSVVVDTV